MKVQRANAPAGRRGQMLLVIGSLLGLVGFGAIVNGTFGPMDDIGVVVLAVSLLLAEFVLVGLYVLVQRPPAADAPPVKA